MWTLDAGKKLQTTPTWTKIIVETFASRRYLTLWSLQKCHCFSFLIFFRHLSEILLTCCNRINLFYWMLGYFFQGYRYFGLNNGEVCYCRDGFDHGIRSYDRDVCLSAATSYKCPGNNNQYCSSHRYVAFFDTGKLNANHWTFPLKLKVSLHNLYNTYFVR